MTSRQRFFEHGLALALCVLAVYALLAPAHIVDGDNAEFSALGAIGGRAHPTGYPLYVLYLRLFSWLPGLSPAHTAGLATVLVATALVVSLHGACRAWGARPLAASVAVALYAASPVVLRMHTEAEVFALNGLVVALVLWFAAAQGPLRGLPRAAALGLVAGLGLANHFTCALVAPVGLLGVVRGLREAPRASVAGLASFAGLALGLSPYVYLWIAVGPMSWGRMEQLSDLVAFVTRADYGGPVAFLPSDTSVSPATNLLAFVTTVGRGWLWVPALGGVAMLVYGCVRGSASEPRAGWIALAVSWLVTGPLLAVRFNMPPTGLGLYVVQRFHLLPLLLLAIPVAAAFDRAGTALASRVQSAALRSSGIAAGLVLLLFVAVTAAALPELRAAHSPAMERGIRNMLRSLPRDAVVIVNSDDLCFGSDYMQLATGERPDVVVACWIATSRTWYRERLAARGVTIRGRFALELNAEHADALMASGRPLFVDRSQKAILNERASYPHGVLIRLLPAGGKPPPVGEVVELNRKLYSEFDLDYPRPRMTDEYAALAHKRYAATWMTLSNALDRSGDVQGAADALELARSLAPAQ